MRIVYDLVFIILGIAYLPYFLITKRYKYGIAERFGILPGRIKSIVSNKRIIWIHGVSMGEMKAVSILAPLLRKSFPSNALVFSTVTHTGNEVARTIATGDEGVFYLPFDISFVVARVVSIIKPEAFLCLEAELWPNLINSIYAANAKIILLNGRISDRSYARYKKIRPFASRIFNKFSLILMQSKRDGERVLDLGAPKDRVFVTGNLKFDLLLSSVADRRREVRKALNIGDGDILFVAGSTSRGEEEQLIECFVKIKKDYKNLRFLIAPRHVERTPEIERLLTKNSFRPIRFSHLSAVNGTRPTIHEESIFILDIMGELNTVYHASDIVFVGGSLIKKRGGQNPIEPASLSKPIIIGKYTSNYHDVVKSFLENHACIEVNDKEGLYSALKSLLDDPARRRQLGINARATVNQNSGSNQRTIEHICSIMPI